MEAYQINDLERITGIKAHTIRIWEKRFNLITPHRTATNIRYYDDDQVRKLLNVSTLVSNGYKISAVATFDEKKINGFVADIHEERIDNKDALAIVFINDLVKATIAFDELFFEKAFALAVARLGVYEAMISVFYPFLKRAGILWSIGEIASVQEHFATNLVRRKLLAAIDAVTPQQKKEKTFLLFLPPDEWHEIALLFADYMIKAAGCKTIYLGQNMPYGALERAVKEIKPDYLLTFYISRREQADIAEPLIALRKQNKQLQILISGSPALFEGIKLPPGIIYLPGPQSALQYI